MKLGDLLLAHLPLNCPGLVQSVEKGTLSGILLMAAAQIMIFKPSVNKSDVFISIGLIPASIFIWLRTKRETKSLLLAGP